MQTTGFGFSQTATSLWQTTQTWKARRTAMVRDAQAANDAVNAAFADAQSRFWAVSAKLAATAALQRVQTQIKAKLNQTAAAATSASKSVGKSVNKVA